MACGRTGLVGRIQHLDILISLVYVISCPFAVIILEIVTIVATVISSCIAGLFVDFSLLQNLRN